MSNDKEWRPKVGDRVVIYGTILKDDDSDIMPFQVATAPGAKDYGWYWLTELHPLPASPEPRKPWEALREAAALMQEANPTSYYGDLLTQASFLEAAATPKPPKLPTLIETVRAYVEYMDDPENLCAMMEALARAENGA